MTRRTAVRASSAVAVFAWSVTIAIIGIFFSGVHVDDIVRAVWAGVVLTIGSLGAVRVWSIGSRSR